MQKIYSEESPHKTQDSSISYGAWKNMKSGDPPVEMGEKDQATLKFDPRFVNSKYSGYAFMLLKPLQKDLAEQLQISRTKTEVKRKFEEKSKEITIGILDGQYSNRIDILHFEQILDLSTNSQTFRN